MILGLEFRPSWSSARTARQLLSPLLCFIAVVAGLTQANTARGDDYVVVTGTNQGIGSFNLNEIVPAGATNISIYADSSARGAYQASGNISWNLSVQLGGITAASSGSVFGPGYSTSEWVQMLGVTYSGGTWTAASVYSSTNGYQYNVNLGSGVISYDLSAWCYADYPEESVTLTVSYTPPPPNATPTGTWAALPGTLYPGASSTVTANGSDTDGNLASITVERRTNGGAWTAFASGGAGSGSSNSASSSFTAGAAGTSYQFRYKVDDAAGATTGWVESGVYTVQTIAVSFNPSPLTFTYNGLPQGPSANPSNGLTTWTATGTPSATDAGTRSVTFTAYGDYSGSWSGNYTINKAGQTVSWSSAPTSVNALSSLTFVAMGASTGSYTWSVSPAGPTGISGTGASQTITFPSAGNYTVSVAAAGDGNYNASSTINVSVTVNSIAPVITSAASATLTYGASGSYQITATNSPTSYGASGLPPGMSINTSTGLISGTPSSVAGSPFTATVSATGAGGTGNQAVTFTVNKAAQSVSWSQSPATASTGGSLTFIASGSSTGSYTWSVAPAGPTGISGTGASQTITFPSSGSYTVSVYATGNANYNQSSTINAGVTVSSSPPVVSSANSVTLTYGTAGSYQITATNSPSSYGASGLPPGMSVNTSTGLISGTPTSTVGSPFTATVSATNGGGTGNLSVTFTVNKAPLTVSASPASKTYGNANPSFTPTYSGFLNGDTAAVLSGTPSLTTAAGANSAVGSYPIAVAAGSLAATNYYFTFANGTLTIGPKAITVTAASPSKVYDGTALAVGTPAVSGLVAGDAVSGFTGTTSVGPAANTYATSVTAITTNFGASNYTPTFVDGTATISRANLTVTANNLSKTYGAVNPTLTASYSGFAVGDTAAVLSGAPALSTTATVSSGAGTYPISVTAGTLSAANYNFTYVNGTLTINPAGQVVAIAPNSASVMTGSNIVFTASGGQTGTYNWSGTAGATGTGTTKSVTFNTAGTYTVVVQAPASVNYTASNLATATITVTAPVAGISLAGSLDFSPTYIGLAQSNRDGGVTSRTLTLTINNTGTGTLTISSANITGASAGSFSVVMVNGGAPNLPFNIAVGGSGTITVQFEPTAETTAGLKTATLTLANNSPNNPSAAVSLSGVANAGFLTSTPGATRSLP